jgi:hypothetical protein
MKTHIVVLFSLFVLFVAGCGTVQPPRDLEAQKVAVRLVTLSASSAYPAAKGKATYKVDNNGIRQFEAEIENILSLKGKVVGVYLGVTKVGAITVNALGESSLRLVGAAAPVIAASSQPRISIKTAAGVTVASGIMNQFK